MTMTSTAPPFLVAGLLALSAAACAVLDPGEPGAQTESGSASTDTGSGDTEPGHDAESGASDSEGETDAGVDDLCEAEDPSTDATITVDLSEWVAGAGTEVDIATTCTVLAVDPAADPVVTSLECDDQGTLRGLGLTIAAAETPVVWQVGESLDVVVEFHPENFDTYEDRREVTVHRSIDGELLLVSVNGNTSTPGIFAPVIWGIDRDRCQPPDPTDLDATWPMILSFDNGMGEVLELGSEQRGTLTPPSGDGSFAIDVGYSIYATCCHEQDGWRTVLLRRTTGS